MQISRIQNSNNQTTSFKKFQITPQAKALAISCPARKEIASRAERVFRYSEYIDFNILDNFVPQIVIKKTGEKLNGIAKACKLDSSKAIRVSDNKINLDFILPSGYTAEAQEKIINNAYDSNSARASYVAELIEKAAKEHNGRFLI